jgi:hypothetical protein
MFTRKEPKQSEVQAQKGPSTPAASSSPPKAPAQSQGASGKTRIIVKYDAGFPNQLFIRGEGAGLSWDKGILLKNVSANEWVWETDSTFKHCEFKVLINDRTYENGENHQPKAGNALSYTPQFPS